MKDKITISELAESTGVSVFSLRRNALNVLKHDSRAKKRSGYARIMDKKEAFHVYFSTILISQFYFSAPEAESMLEYLEGSNSMLKDRVFYYRVDNRIFLKDPSSKAFIQVLPLADLINEFNITISKIRRKQYKINQNPKKIIY